MQIINGTVKYAAGPPRDGQYGPSINVLITLETGDDIRVYGKPGDYIERLKSREAVKVVEDKGKYKVVEKLDVPDVAKEPEEKPDLAAMAFELSVTMSQAYIDIYNRMIEAGVPHENATAATSTIFIQLFQKLR
jgi:hypothetical protein